MKTVSKNQLLQLIAMSGQIVEHKCEKMQEHGMDETQLLKALEENEKEELTRLLKKLQTQWFADNKERLKRLKEKEENNNL